MMTKKMVKMRRSLLQMERRQTGPQRRAPPRGRLPKPLKRNHQHLHHPKNPKRAKQQPSKYILVVNMQPLFPALSSFIRSKMVVKICLTVTLNHVKLITQIYFITPSKK